MNGIPSSTFFSAPPDWGWLIVFTFFSEASPADAIFSLRSSIYWAGRRIVLSPAWVTTSRFPA